MLNRLALLVAGCFFMETLDATIVTTAAPRIAADLHVSPRATGVLITAYLVALAVVIPLGGWLLTRLRARTVFTLAIAVFTAMSLACGLAGDLTTLVVFRILQGVGGALMVPVGRQLVLRDAPRSQIQRLMAFIVWPGLVAPVIAPLVGGLITTDLSWHWIFLVNVPLGLAVIPIALRIVPATVEGPARRFDWAGFSLTGAALATLTWAGYLVGDGRSVARWLPWALAAGVLSLLAVWHLRRASHPVVALGVLADRTFAVSQLAAVGFWMVVMAVPYLLALMLQVSAGRGPVAAGTIVMFVFVGNIAIKPATGRLLNTFGYRGVLAASTLGLAVCSSAIGLCPPGAPAAALAGLALLSGVARSTALTALATIGFDTIDPAQRRDANTLSSIVMQVSGGLGVAVAAIGVSLGAALTGNATGHATFEWAFLLLAAVGLVPAAAVWLLPAAAGDHLRVPMRASAAGPVTGRAGNAGR